MAKIRIIALLFVIGGAALGFFVYGVQTNFPFKLGLDLSGGTELIYQADLSSITSEDIEGVMESLQEVIERRVNDREVAGVLGVLDPVVQIEKSGILGGVTYHRLIVELPGVSDLDKAKEFIDKTPLLEFKLLKPEAGSLNEEDLLNKEDLFIPTGLTGQFLKDARFELANSGVGFIEPVVTIRFNKEGTELFSSITKDHVGEVLAIFLDGKPISLPVIREEIGGGQAQISGDFTKEEAQELARNLKLGATPVPIALVSAQKVGPTLGGETVGDGIKAGMFGLSLVALFLIFWYRLPGLIAVISLALYLIITLALFKLIPVTLTASGIAGLILSIGMAVDANVIIFERLKEEIKVRENLREAIREAFSRSWLPVRDANLTTLITSLVLFSMFKTSLVRGFALVLGIGVLVSMFTAVTVTRLFLMSISKERVNPSIKFIFGSGLK
ncbi:MAG: preprotein translocase subunit SecD [Parcubacteria group bacterium Gr01-1014_107]|nr:MAG: preprotein translocase subunit SecD [Parcubacteria group bacterium Gr01-1014_107]